MQGGDALSDDQLIQQCLNNNEEAGRELFIRYALYLHRIAYRSTFNQCIAEEVSQEAWLKIFQNLHTYQSGTSFRTWAARICYNLCVDHVRKKQKQQAVDQTVLKQMFYPARLLPIDVADRNETFEQVLAVLRSLPEALRTAFSLRYFEDMSYKEIANVVGCPVKTARTRVFRATQVLREEFA
jgi:RNA polymerase sigma-70 factor (ECF subfamily)